MMKKKFFDLFPRVLIGLFYEIWHWCCVFLPLGEGIQKNKDENHLIVSLTSYGKRLKWIAPCLDSLLSQSLKPTMVILWIRKKDKVPKTVLRLKKRGLQIQTVPNDFGSYNKYVHTRKMYPDSIIVTADDDMTYSRSWLKKLHKSYLKNPKAVHFHRGYTVKIKKDLSGKKVLDDYNNWKPLKSNQEKCGYLLIPTGNGGVLYGSSHKHPDLLNNKIFMNIAPKQDDIWFKLIGILAHLPSIKIKNKKGFFTTYHPMYLGQLIRKSELPLWKKNINKGGNNLALSKAIKHYPKFFKILLNKESEESFHDLA